MSKMSKLQKLAKQNPKVDEAKAKETIDAVKTLRTQGIRVRGYSLKNPFRVRNGTIPSFRLSGRPKLKDYA